MYYFYIACICVVQGACDLGSDCSIIDSGGEYIVMEDGLEVARIPAEIIVCPPVLPRMQIQIKIIYY